MYSDDQDALHASSIYSLLENEIVPMFYEQRDQTPREWLRRVKQTLTYISPVFDCRRMVREYMSELYDPANEAHKRMTQGSFETARDRATWNSRVREVWERGRFVETGASGPGGSVTSGRPV